MIRSAGLLLCLLLLTGRESLAQTDSLRLLIVPRDSVSVDTTDFFEKKLQLSSVHPIFSGTSRYGDLFAGFNFNFGTLFDGKTKSSYPGFIGFGIQAGWKYKSGILAETSWEFHQMNTDVAYTPPDRYRTNGSLTGIETRSVTDAAVDHQLIMISLVYSDYRSVILPLRYAYFGLGAGVMKVRETGRLTALTVWQDGVTGVSSELNTKALSYYYWNPVATVILGMNFLYLPESHNWFSFDLRVDIAPNVNATDEASVFSRASDFSGFRATARFYFDFRK